jgi:hypothetical protein
VAAFIVWTAYAVFVRGQAHIYAENRLLENVQAVVLAVACLVFLASAVRHQGADRLVLLLCSLLCYSFVLRELDVERLDVPEVLKLIGSGTGRNVTLAAAFIALFSCAAMQGSRCKRVVADFLRSRAGVLLLAGGAFLLLGDGAEKFKTLAHHVYFEEVLELLGYVSILLSAFAAGSCTAAASAGRTADEETQAGQ